MGDYITKKAPNSLPDADYILTEDAGWFTVRNLSIRIKVQEFGVVVDIYPAGKEDESAIASTYAYFEQGTQEV